MPLLPLALAVLALLPGPPLRDDEIVVGSKNFTESVVLGELMAQMIEEHSALQVERRMSLGGTPVCWGALREGELDLYADYTGTGWAILLKEPGKITDPLRAYFHVRGRSRDEFDVHWLEPFGLNNTYALAMPEARAAELEVRRISDLARVQDELRARFSIEFGNREDGLPGLTAAYGLEFGDVRVLEHGLAYQGVAAGEVDLIDAYSTDAKLLRHELRILQDDRSFFPPYNACPLVRGATLREHPEIADILGRLAFCLDDPLAQTLNYLVEARGHAPRSVARAFLEWKELVDRDPEDAPSPGDHPRLDQARADLQQFLRDRPEPGSASDAPRPGLLELLGRRTARTLQLTGQHLALTLVAVLLASLLAIPLGIATSRRPRLRRITLGLAGVLQTIPSLALLAFMIPLLGLGVKAAIAALFLYALLPILRNTDTGITEVDPTLIDVARGMGLRDGEILRLVQLPLASRTIMAGVRTATVISIGVATLAAFIGAGGLGEPIVEGLYLDDTARILSGAIPAAVLAVLVDLGLGLCERALAPRTRSRS